MSSISPNLEAPASLPTAPEPEIEAPGPSSKSPSNSHIEATPQELLLIKFMVQQASMTSLPESISYPPLSFRSFMQRAEQHSAAVALESSEAEMLPGAASSMNSTEAQVQLLEEFHLFSKLPKELRLRVWELDAQSPKVIKVRIDVEMTYERVMLDQHMFLLVDHGRRAYDRFNPVFDLYPAHEHLGALQTCSESREIGQKATRDYLQYGRGPRIECNLNQDTVLFDLTSLYFLCAAIRCRPTAFTPYDFPGLADIQRIATPFRFPLSKVGYKFLTQTVLTKLVSPFTTVNTIEDNKAWEKVLYTVIDAKFEHAMRGNTTVTESRKRFLRKQVKERFPMEISTFLASPTSENGSVWLRNALGEFATGLSCTI